MGRMSDSELIARTEVSRRALLAKTLLALNNAHAQELSWLEPERLQHLVEQAFLTRRIGDLDAFLLAFDQDARYDSPNFLWFGSRALIESWPRTISQRVVPANAGTHTARTLVPALEQRPFFTFEARDDGSLRSQGRPAE